MLHIGYSCFFLNENKVGKVHVQCMWGSQVMAKLQERERTFADVTVKEKH